MKLEEKIAGYEEQLKQQMAARDLAIVNIHRLQGAIIALQSLIEEDGGEEE